MRGADEFVGRLGHIGGAINLPPEELPARLTEIKAGKDQPVILVCRTDRRSAATAAKAGQQTPDGHYNVERMLKRVLAGKGEALLCGTCMDARGLADADVVAGARRSTMDELAAATIDADKVLVF